MGLCRNNEKHGCVVVKVLYMLRKIRIVFAVIIFTMITFYFLDFTGILPMAFHGLAHIQFIPALLSGSFVILGFLLLITLLFGRVYCSVICPMGVFQDVVAWLARRINKKKRYVFSREKKFLRYAMLVVMVAAFFTSATVIASLLDPYSAYSRVVVNVFRPIYMGANNLLAAVLNHFDNYTLYHTDIFILSLFSLIIGLLTFIIIAFLAYRYGRTYCNTICPVGTLLGVVSRWSLWRVRLDKDACVSCGLCEKKCKAACIDSKGKTIDHSRCVACYDCLSSCHKKALSYRPLLKRVASESVTGPSDQSKRRFVSALAVVALAVPRKVMAKGEAVVANNQSYKKKNPISPPGAGGAEHLLHHCTACHLCVAKCPSRVLKPAFMEYGVGGMMQPLMDFEHGFCNFDCTVCADVCPNGALQKLTKDEKHQLQVGRVVFVRENCIVNTDETSCGACSEHCPTQAVSMQPYKNGLTIPVVNADICVGCGGCEYVCPVRPFRAIYIEGNLQHQQAVPFKEAEKKDVKLDDFGF